MRFLLAAAVVTIGVSVPLGAQTPQPIEVSPFAGYFFGGTILGYPTHLAFADEATFGVRIGWNATPQIEPELQWSRTKTEFSPLPVNFVKLNVDYFLGGASYNFVSGAVRPYVSLDLGAAHIDAIDFVPETLFTISVGAGIKYFFTPNFGLRLDARGYTSPTNDELKGICQVQGPSGSISSCTKNWLLNGDVTGGLVVAF